MCFLAHSQVVRGGSGVMLVGHTGVGKTQLMAQVVASLGLGTTGSRCKVQKNHILDITMLIHEYT